MYVTGRQRHNQAMLAPSRKDEKAIVQMLRGLQDYQEILEASEAEAARAVLTQGLSDIARGLQKLLQGPMGRLDAELVAEELAPFFHENGLSLVAPRDDDGQRDAEDLRGAEETPLPKTQSG